MTRTLHLPGQIALAARTVSGLSAWTNFAHFGDVALEGVKILIVEAFPIRAVIGLALPPPSTASAKIATARVASSAAAAAPALRARAPRTTAAEII
jgi:hypothetical protein